MAIPPSINSILPSLTITERGTGTRAVLSLADLKKLVPSLEIVPVGDEAPLNGKLELSMDDLRKIFALPCQESTSMNLGICRKFPLLSRI